MVPYKLVILSIDSDGQAGITNETDDGFQATDNVSELKLF